MKARFFATPAELRRWFEKNHEREPELLVGYYKKGSGKKSVTWPESVDEALCVGWIDGIRRSLGDESYTIRFTPRRARSIWSVVNAARAKALEREGRMRPAGRKAFAAREEYRYGIYSYEQRRDRLEEPYASMLKENAAASKFFDEQPASYRKAAGWWVVSAKREETRMGRLERLIAHSARGERIPEFTRLVPGAGRRKGRR
ncbi:MAG TPA: YdeI/OmpD-associated family protein [Thermoanaerobaculia bacterium]|nr:YdeI/OmpD-associated family protein [Thermoanaerobaculia bacterium]